MRAPTTDNSDSCITLPNSPIEFAITGPIGGRDRVLVRSRDAGLDLIGLAAQSGLDSRSDPAPSLFSVILGPSRQLNIIASFPFADVRPESDSRESRFSFAWKGYAAAPGVECVKEAFNAALPELHRSIQGSNRQETEWTLSPVIYCCTQANERGLRMRRLMWASLAIYSAVALTVVLAELS